MPFLRLSRHYARHHYHFSPYYYDYGDFMLHAIAAALIRHAAISLRAMFAQRFRDTRRSRQLR